MKHIKFIFMFFVSLLITISCSTPSKNKTEDQQYFNFKVNGGEFQNQEFNSELQGFPFSCALYDTGSKTTLGMVVAQKENMLSSTFLIFQGNQPNTFTISSENNLSNSIMISDFSFKEGHRCFNIINGTLNINYYGDVGDYIKGDFNGDFSYLELSDSIYTHWDSTFIVFDSTITYYNPNYTIIDTVNIEGTFKLKRAEDINLNYDF